mgnify:CR=1 FL=1
MRGVPDSFTDALVMGERPTIDIRRAREQHAAYVQFLGDNGYGVMMVATDEAYPDCPFVEDVAVVLETIAVQTRPGAQARRGEVGAVAEALAALRPLRRIIAPGTVDGGDVIRLADTVYVGLSQRTNREGIDQLAEFAAEDGLRTVPIAVRGVLHLKSAVARLDDETLLLAPDCVDEGMFDGYRIIEKDPAESHLASVLALANGAMAMTTTAPRTLGFLHDAGYQPTLLDSSEFQAVDGGLTCLSVLIEPLG